MTSLGWNKGRGKRVEVGRKAKAAKAARAGL